ncbi:hypothetical protein PG996_008047 [Apiospora saccharicola]|uniref:Ubiquitin-like domain-containing protein n=1 Tax=Apiospora saccharicola TaxID=335842 RepID=A0ABR1UZ99_9PEZI
MEVALAFGSVGDIIAICQIAIKLSRALGVGCAEASGSAKEYQALRKDLDTFARVLEQVIAEYQQLESCPSLTNLDAQTKTVVNECATLIQDALNRWCPKYHESLQPGGSGSTVKDALRKIEWSVREKQGIQELQDKLHRNTEKLALLTWITSRHAARAENASLLANINEVKIIVAKSQTDQQLLQGALQLQRVENSARHSDLGRRLEAQATGLMSIMTVLIAVFRELGQVKTLVAVVLLHLQAMMSTPLRPGLDPTRGLPVFFEDALGEVLELPLQWLHDWNSFNSLLEMWFSKRKGLELVQSRLFALEDDCSGQDIDRNLPMSTCLRRGMKINMSFIFTEDGLRGCCPRCGTTMSNQNNNNVQCSVVQGIPNLNGYR